MSPTQQLTETDQKTRALGPIIDNYPLRVGIVAAPGLSEVKVKQVFEELANLFYHHVDNRYLWQASLEVDPLIGAHDDTKRLLAKAHEHKKARHWDYVICVTDLPMLRNHKLAVAEASTRQSIAVLCLPALGTAFLKRRLRESCVQLVNELYHGSSPEARNRQQEHTRRQRRQRQKHGLRNHNARALIANGPTERLVPVRRENLHGNKRSIDVLFTSAPHIRAIIKVLLGMARANQPLLIVPTFRRVIAVAFATGAYGLLFQTLWRLSDVYSSSRLVILMSGAIIAMILWLIIDHDLWARRFKHGARLLVTLNNLTTIITLLIGVISYYTILFMFFFIAVLVLVTPGLFQEAVGHGIDMKNYLFLAWLATSISTVAGALGASLESSDTVRNATYGHRQRHRYQQAKEAQDFQEDGQQ